jgi:antitoxin VapB
MDRAVRAVRPGQSEYEIAGLLAYETERRGVQCIVNLVATDERISSFRHPLPTGKKMERYAMLVQCGRRRGMVGSCTRLVHFGRVPDDLRRKSEAVAKIDAVFISATRPGRTLGEVFERARATYAETGYANEWRLHHQGGPVGYEAREAIAVPGLTDVVQVGQPYAWNPSITGTKCEDTILVGASGNEVLTEIPGWPTIAVTLPGEAGPILGPATLEIA